MRLVGSGRWVRRTALAMVGAVSASLLVAAPVSADPKPPKVQEEDYVSGRDLPRKAPKKQPREETNPAPTPPTSWPASGSAEVQVGAGQRVRAGSLPVWVGPATGKAGTGARAGAAGASPVVTPGKVRVDLLDGKISQRAKLRGPLLRVSRTDGQAATGKAGIEVDYSGFRYAYGGDYASRLRLVRLPDCAATTPEKAQCQAATPVHTRNDVTKSRLGADVDVPATGGSAGGAVFAAVAAAGTESGDYKATPLSQSAQWQVSAQTGDFGWSYPLRVPPPAGGPSPDLTITYSSGGVDGRTSATNNQTSWIGEGFDFWQGYIERKYKACLDDTGDGSPKTGDLCWSHDNATMVLNGSATELVLDDDTKTWHPRNDDGSKIEKLTGAVNGDDGDSGDDGDQGEHWKLTTTDGTQYFFGLNRLNKWTTGKEQTDSAWTVPVFGNGSDEPCHGSSYASSWCQQAWRWNLDMVVDPHGNAMTYFYEKETNHYGLNMKADVAGTAYHRGGWLKRIDYGQNKDTLFSASAPAQVVFEPAERCEPGGTVTCAPSQLNDSTATYWRDVPYDQNCNAGEMCTKRHSPTFWSRKRLVKVTTQILRPDAKYCATAYCPVDSWALTQTYPASGDGSRSALWLSSIQHSGHRSGTLSMPEVTFTGKQLANRVFNPDGEDGVVPLYKRRMESIVSESGGEIRINYKATECVRPGAIPSSVDDNNMRCFPQHWAPDDEPDRLDWFHKYVVEQVVQNDLVAAGPQMVTDYEYVGDPAWHYDDDDGITPPKRKTWSQYRGYAKVKIRNGASNGTRSLTETHYFRGMDGDKQTDGTPRDVSLTSTEGDTYVDHWRRAGQPFETTVYNGSSVVSKVINEPWQSERTARRVMDWGNSTAYMADTAQVKTYNALDNARGWRKGAVQREFDSAGLVSQVTDWGEIGKAGDETCTKYTYARNPGAHMLTYASRVEAYAKPCNVTPTLPDDFISHAKTYYDDPAKAHGTAPAKGDVVKVEEVSGFTGTTPTWQTVMTRTYDGLGRETSTTDADDKSSTTAYTDVGGLLTSVKTTNPKLHESITHIDPAWGVPQAEIDPNEARTDIVYDALGRVSKVWLPGQTMGGEPHNSEFAYDIRKSLPSVVTTKTRRNDGTYGVSYELYDGWLRSRQTQLRTHEAGRIISDTFYDSRGLVEKKYANYADPEPPGTTLFEPNGDDVPTATAFTYDGTGRPIVETMLARGSEKWKRTIGYGGDRVRVTPPTGETPTMTVNDIGGRTTELHQYKGSAPSGDADVTRYAYNPRGQLLTVTDPTTKNVWRNEYDARGRTTKVHDPDKGTSEFTYDVLGRVATVKDARQKTLAYTYDELSRKTGMYEGSTAGTKLAEWTFDTLKLGLPTASTRYVDGQAYTTAVNTYDENYRPTKTTVTIPSKDGLTTYSSAGTGTLAGDHQFQTIYHFDGLVLGRRVPAAGDLPAEIFSYAYDIFGLPERTQGSTTYVTDSVYSRTGQLLQEHLSTGTQKTYRTFEYDDATDRLTRAYTTRGSQTGTPVTDVRYDYDDAGNVLSVADTPADGTAADIQCFDYDYLRRLETAWTARTDCATAPTDANKDTVVGGAAPYWQSFGYDLVGNRETETQHGLGGAADTERAYTTPDAGAAQPHSLSSVRETRAPAAGQPGIDKQDDYLYDASGNTITRKVSGNEQKLEWDAEGHLASVTEGGKTTSFVYDADGNRLLRKDPSGTTLYLGEQEINLSATTGTAKGTRYISHGGAPVAVRTAQGVQWLIDDHQGTGQVAINAAAAPGQGIQRRYQTPFGGPRGSQPASWPGERGFVGGTVDASTKLTHLGAREYDPTTGRFISVDPLIDVGNPQQMHGYAYAGNSPVTKSDPTGLMEDGPRNGNTFCTVACGGGDRPPGGGGGGGGGGGAAPPALTAQEQHAVDQAKVIKKKSLTQVILETGGAVLLDVIGVTDIYNCVKGSIGSCISAVAGAVPWYKLGKFVKAAHRAVKGVMSWVGQVKWADNVIKAASSKIARAEAAAKQAAQKADDVPDAVAKNDPPKATADAGDGPTCPIGNSFTPDTKVLMADGSTKPIEDVKIGDEVIATDPETGKTRKRKVVAAIVGEGSKNLVEITVDAGGQIKKPGAGKGTEQAANSPAKTGNVDVAGTGTVIATDGHPFWVADLRVWVDASKLLPGMWLRTSAGTHVHVKAIRAWTTPQRVHNLTIDRTHTYYVEAGDTPVLVHNCDGEIHRVSENANMSSAARAYDAGAAGSEPGVAPALQYYKAGGSNLSQIKFDGYDAINGVMIDRKLAVTTFNKAFRQAQNQSLALEQNGLTGVWEVPNAAQAARARSILGQQLIMNIKVRIVTP